jgi:hypothetical protein
MSAILTKASLKHKTTMLHSRFSIATHTHALHPSQGTVRCADALHIARYASDELSLARQVDGCVGRDANKRGSIRYCHEREYIA